MLALLTLGLASLAVLGAYAFLRRLFWRRRQPGLLLQSVVSPPWADAFLWASGLGAVLSVMVLLVMDVETFQAGGWLVVLPFILCAIETSGWVSGLFHFGFYETGLWYGRSWYRYRDVQSYEVDRDRIRLQVGGRHLTLRSDGTLLAEIRVRLAVDDFPLR